MKKVVFLMLVLSFLGCQSTGISNVPVEPNLGEKFVLGIGQEATFVGEGISIRFKELLEESRCPKGVMCVWSGNAKIAIQFNEEEFRLNTHVDPETLLIGDYKVELASLDPYPRDKVKIKPEEYIATFIVSKQ